MEATSEEIDRLIRTVDIDKSGTLSFEEFVTMVCLMAANEEKEREQHRANLRVVFDSVGESAPCLPSTSALSSLRHCVVNRLRQERLDLNRGAR
jgi:hypothetical protein